MSDTVANQKAFPQNRKQQPGLGFPLAMLVGVISLSCGAILDWAIGPCEGKQTGETALLRNLAAHFQRADLLIADRCYSGYFMVAQMAMLGVDVLVRQNARRRTDFSGAQRLGKGDHIVTWRRPARPDWMSPETYQTVPATLTMREIECGTLTLATTLLDPGSAHARELLALYHGRWNIELDLRSIKDVMQMGVLRCKSPEMVRKEIAVHFIAYNLVCALMTQAAQLNDIMPRALRFKLTLQTLRVYQPGNSPRSDQQAANEAVLILQAIARAPLPKRPGRTEPRVKKRRPKPTKLMTQPRSVLRAQCLKQNQFTQPSA